jgi:hypothetical protein
LQVFEALQGPIQRRLLTPWKQSECQEYHLAIRGSIHGPYYCAVSFVIGGGKAHSCG